MIFFFFFFTLDRAKEHPKILHWSSNYVWNCSRNGSKEVKKKKKANRPTGSSCVLKSFSPPKVPEGFPVKLLKGVEGKKKRRSWSWASLFVQNKRHFSFLHPGVPQDQSCFLQMMMELMMSESSQIQPANTKPPVRRNKISIIFLQLLIIEFH